MVPKVEDRWYPHKEWKILQKNNLTDKVVELRNKNGKGGKKPKGKKGGANQKRNAQGKRKAAEVKADADEPNSS